MLQRLTFLLSVVNVAVIVMDTRRPLDAPLIHLLRIAHMQATKVVLPIYPSFAARNPPPYFYP